MKKTMTAVICDKPGGYEVLQVRNIPIPEPSDDQIRIKIAYCSLNPMDIFAREGKVKWLPINWPFIPGIEHSGVIDKVGRNLDKKLLGVRVHSRNIFGGNAEFSLINKQDIKFFPNNLDWKIGTTYGGMTYTAFHALEVVPKITKESVCIFHSAAGPIGIMLTQIAKERNAKVIGLCSREKFDYAKKFGADHLIDYNKDGWEKKIYRITNNNGVDLIIDGNQGKKSLSNFNLLKPGGHILFIGATDGYNKKNFDIPTLINKSIFIGGFNLPLIEKIYDRKEKLIIDKIKNNDWLIPISQTIKLHEIPEIHKQFNEKKIFGRVIIKVAGDLDYKRNMNEK